MREIIYVIVSVWLMSVFGGAIDAMRGENDNDTTYRNF